MPRLASPHADPSSEVTDWDGARTRVVGLLADRGAASIAHPHGTLLEHLLGTEQLLRTWGSSEVLCLAGLAHAVYGTDGFAPHLLELEERHLLTAAAGSEAEALVYLYASCDRGAVYPQFERPGPIEFRDRFTGKASRPSEDELRDFADLTLANEFEITVLGGNGDVPLWLLQLFEHIKTRASDFGRQGAGALLAASRAARPW
jgi:hypothetical protein